MGDMLDFNYMLKKVVQKNPGMFVGYGNYCGKGDIGGKPVDKIDECCQAHDNCYGEWENKHKKEALHTKYDWEVVVVGDTRKVKCNDKTADLKSLCVCDMEVAYCFRDNIHHFDKKHYSRQYWERIAVSLANEVDKTKKQASELDEDNLFINY